ncbi:MAG: hypothetical protein QNJ67_02845 [Kiloniellales bacterium]|nr:hypothetical protein [Kiloniellales bacterium]
MVIWTRVQNLKRRRDERQSAARVKDLELAASFVRSIETGDVRTDVEIGELATRLQELAWEATARSLSANRPATPCAAKND